MQVSVEKAGQLRRIMRVELPEEKIAPAVASRLQSMTKTTQLQGFRPGKAPLKIIRQRYAGQVRREVVGQAVQDSFYEALADEKLQLAGSPLIDPLEDRPGRGLAYTATFEVVPQVELRPLAELRIEKPVCQLDDADIDKMIARLRRQRRASQAVERPAEMGDQVTIDLHGMVDGEDFAGGKAEAMKVELGSKRLLAGMEDGLVGKQAGDELTLDLRFPADYHQQQLAGQPVAFTIRVNEVAVLLEPPLDDAFFAAFGVSEGGMAAFRRAINAQLEKDLAMALRGRWRDAALASLYEAHELPLPEAMVDAEVQRMEQQFKDNLKAQGIADDASNLPGALSGPARFKQPARKRVALQLLIGEVIAANELKAAPDKVRALIEQHAAAYQDPAAVINWYYGDEKKLAEAEAMVLEEAVVDWLLAHAKVTEKPLSFDELMNNRQT